MDDFRAWSRPIPGQDPGFVASYIDDEIRDNGQRQRSAMEHQYGIWLWLYGMSLYADAFPAYAGLRTYSSGAHDVAGTDNQQYWTRFSLLTLAGRSAKPALDLILSCYYTEAWTLVRTMLDGWGRAVFLRLQPEEYRRWINSGEGEPEPKRGPNWQAMEEVACKSGDEELQALFDAAHLRWRLLNLAAHPTGFGLTQTHDETLDLMTFRPDYDPGACNASLALGVFVLRLLLRQVADLDEHPEQWVKSRARFDDVADAFGESLHAALAAEARALDDERARNPKWMTPCTRNRWERRRQEEGNEERGETPAD